VHSLAFISLASIASIATFAAFAPVAVASDERIGTPAGAPPVLRSYEPADSVVFRLPGPPAAVPIARKTPDGSSGGHRVAAARETCAQPGSGAAGYGPC